MAKTKGIPDHVDLDPKTNPTLPIPVAGSLLGLGYAASYRAAAEGYIPTIQTSATRRVVPTAELLRMLRVDTPQIDGGA